MKLSSFIGGVFGTMGFVLSIFAGMVADNAMEAILLKGILSAFICYIVGYIVGLIAQQVALEHAERLAKMVADSDSAAELKAAEAIAEQDAEAAMASRGETVPTAPMVPGK